MSLRMVVAAPFRQRGQERMPESEFVVVLSLDRDWFSPDQASRVADRAVGEGLLTRTDDETLSPTFDPDAVTVPPDFTPDESLLQRQSTFERTLEALVAADIPKQEAVAGINQLQADLDLTIEAAAVVYAKRQDLDVTAIAEQASEAISQGE
ncbi:MAG: DUF2240 family protein [Halobacteriales archaeon]